MCFQNRNERFCPKTQATICQTPALNPKTVKHQGIHPNSCKVTQAKMGSRVPRSQHLPEGPDGRSKEGPQISRTGQGWAGGWLRQAWPELSPGQPLEGWAVPRGWAGPQSKHRLRRHQLTETEHPGREQTLLTICEESSFHPRYCLMLALLPG